MKISRTIKMLLTYYLFVISVVFAHDARRINDYIVKIDDSGNLESIEATMESRKELDLSNLQIKKIGPRAFSSNLSGLEILDLSRNKLGLLEHSIFKNLTNLRNLSLAITDFSTFGGAFVGLDNLSYLDLSFKSIEGIINRGYFFGLRDSCVIATTLSRIGTITSDAFEEDDSDKIVHHDVNDNDSDSLAKEEEDSSWSNMRAMVCIKNGGIVEQVRLVMNNVSAPSDCQIINFSPPTTVLNGWILELEEMSIVSFEAGWYRLGDFPIAGISLRSNKIANLTDQIFNELPKNIKALEISSNIIETLKNLTIENPHLRLLDLNSNGINHIDDGTFARMKLTSLDLDWNRLKSTKFVMTLPTTLTTLSITDNDISYLSDGSFERLDKLISLRLDSNKIIDIAEPGTFRGLFNLEILGLTEMNIRSIAPGAFRHLTKLKVLYLNDNEMENLRGGIFEGLVNLGELDLSNNRINSLDCAKNGSEHEKSSIFNLPNLSRLHLVLNQLTEIKGEYFEGLEGLTFLDLSLNNIAKIGKNFGQNMPKLQELNLRDNHIVNLESENFVDSPKNILYLDNNEISIIDNGAFKLPSLRHLGLGTNKLTVIEAEIFASLTSLEVLALWSNSITKISNGTAKYLGNLKNLSLFKNPLRILKNGAFCGLPKTSEKNCHIDLSNVPLLFIEAGVFNC